MYLLQLRVYTWAKLRLRTLALTLTYRRHHLVSIHNVTILKHHSNETVMKPNLKLLQMSDDVYGCVFAMQALQRLKKPPPAPTTPTATLIISTSRQEVRCRHRMTRPRRSHRSVGELTIWGATFGVMRHLIFVWRGVLCIACLVRSKCLCELSLRLICCSQNVGSLTRYNWWSN